MDCCTTSILLLLLEQLDRIPTRSTELQRKLRDGE
jgi:hypothetical protein